MNNKIFKVTAIVVVFAFCTSSCENLSHGENAAVFGTVAGLAVGIPLAVAGVDPRVVIPVTAGAVALAAGGAYVISKHQATVKQRKIAEQRARIYLAKRQEAEKAAAQAAARSQRTASESSSSQTAEAKPKPKPKAKEQSRYIAVKTEKEDFNKGKEAVMIFDTQTNGIVGNQVFDLKATPKVGSVQKFDTYSAEYVGG